MKDHFEFEDEPTGERPTFEQALEALRTGDASQDDERVLYGLSDITEQQAVELMTVWREIDAEERFVLMQTLVDEMESNFDLNYDQIALQTMHDPDERIRRASVEMLIATEDRGLFNALIDAASTDSSVLVRTDALRGITAFCKDGAYEDMPAYRLERVRTLAGRAWSHEANAVEERGAALELLAAMDAPLDGAIESAYYSGDDTLRHSALAAMGLTADSDTWGELVLEELHRSLPSREAARAAGQLELVEAIPLLVQLVNNPESDAREEAILSLGDIGGKEALRVLSALAEEAEEAEDHDLLMLIEDALANASMNDGNLFPFQ